MDLPKVPLKLVIPHEEIILRHMRLVMVKTINLKKEKKMGLVKIS
jgi:hypothetical protein